MVFSICIRSASWDLVAPAPQRCCPKWCGLFVTHEKTSMSVVAAAPRRGIHSVVDAKSHLFFAAVTLRVECCCSTNGAMGMSETRSEDLNSQRASRRCQEYVKLRAAVTPDHGIPTQPIDDPQPRPTSPIDDPPPSVPADLPPPTPIDQPVPRPTDPPVPTPTDASMS